jgi:PhnB protein
MTVTPYLTMSDANAAIEFYKKAFGAIEKARMPAEDGKRLMHAELEIAGGRLFLSDDFQNTGGKPAMASVFIGLDKAKDVDYMAGLARAAGATINQLPQDMFWGDRFAQLTDPFGHNWMIGAPKDK